MSRIVRFRHWLASAAKSFFLGLPATLAYWTDKHFCPDYQSLGIRILDSDEKTRNRFISLVENALTLISTEDRRRFKRVQRHVQVIANQPLYGRSKYFHIPKVCALDLRRFCNQDVETVVPRLAASIIHAATRGMLFTAGIFQTRSNYLRVEELCYRESQRFALRIAYEVSYSDAIEKLGQSPIPLRSRWRWFRGELAKLMCKQEREGKGSDRNGA